MTTTIWDQLETLYTRVPGRNLRDDLKYFIQTGYVFAGPDYFIMGRQIGDGWYIQAAVGRGALGRFIQLMPHPLPLIGWRREKKHKCEVVWHRTEQLRRILNYARSNASTAKTTHAAVERPGRD